MILDDKFQYDFLIYPNIIIEVQGDYWHGNPKFYGKNKKPLNQIQVLKKEQDVKKRKFAQKNGYKVYYIWENEINQEKFGIINKCLQNLN